jgi:hypothetical protein
MRSSVSPQPQTTTDLHTGQGQEHGIRLEKRRRAGGFLLPSALRHTSDGRHHHHGYDDKGKEKEKEKVSVGSASASLSTPGRSNGAMRSSPLAQVVVSPRPSYGEGTRSRPSTEVDSTPRSDASSSQPRASSDWTLGVDESMFGQQHASGIDPAQIVSMALNLNEGRRRHLGAGQLLQQQAGGARRAASVAMPSPGMLQGSFQNAGAGGSLRQALSQQKRSSRNHSPGSAGKGTSSRHVSAAHSFLPAEAAGASFAGPDLFYRFSPSTLARAEKARQYIELSVEYRRLLDYLPPLRPDTGASGNYEYTTYSVPGTPNVELQRSPTATAEHRRELGRRYNPLQMIRNRKLRMRSRMDLKPDVEQFVDTGAVREWIDEVEDMSTRPGYRAGDSVRLPVYPEDGSSTSAPASSHQRNDSTNKPKRQRTDWAFTPSEHIADAYWMEMDSHKRLIENKHGTKIFTPATVPESYPHRTSYESRRSHRSQKGSIATSGSFDPLQHEENEDGDSARGHKRHHHHLHVHRRDESRGRLKQVWHKARRKSRSSSSGLSSSDEGPLGPAHKAPRITSAGDNIGPLAKHIDRLLDGQDQQKRSPDLISPGTPNKWGETVSKAPSSKKLAETENRHSDTDNIPRGSAIRNYRGKGSQRDTPDSATGQHSRRFDSRSSFEDFHSTNPNSPAMGAHIPNMSTDLSPAGSRAASPPRSLGKPLLPFMRNEQARSYRKGSNGEDGNLSSRQTSAEVTSNPRNSLEVPPTPERLRLHRHRTTDSLRDTLSKTEINDRDGKDTKEPQSAVRRFFKGGRIGEMVRGEGAKVTGRNRRRDSPQDSSTLDDQMNIDTDSMEESDTEEIDLNSIREKPALQRSSTGWSQKYSSDKLPSFRSTKVNGNHQHDPDHISKQRSELLHNRSSKLSTLAPPSLDISRVNSSSSNFADISRTNTKASDSSRDDRRNAYGYASQNRNRSRLGTRLEAILDVPGTVGSGGLPVTGLSELSNEKPPARPNMKDKRQWSISDKPRSRSRDPRAPSLNAADIARIRALLICSGIKAATIGQRAFTLRDPPEFLRKAAETCNAEVIPVKRSEEHVLAAKLLTTHLETETSALHNDADYFLSRTAGGLKQDLRDLKENVSCLIKTAQNLGDSCVGFGSEVTGQRTLQVRQVVDQLEKLSRARRRRMKWARRIGFGLGEWAVVLVIWSFWFLYVVCKTIWTVIRGLGLTVKWILWL